MAVPAEHKEGGLLHPLLALGRNQPLVGHELFGFFVPAGDG